MEILTTGPKRAMAVTPHPDDCEGGCGGALAKWVKEFGTVASVVMCTNGNKGTGDRNMTSEKLAATRVIEQQDASNIVGVTDVVLGAYNYNLGIGLFVGCFTSGGTTMCQCCAGGAL